MSPTASHRPSASSHGSRGPVARAEHELRKFWTEGAASIAKTPAYPVGGAAKDAKQSEADRLGWNPEKLRMARLFASRCSEAELENLIAQAEAHDYPPAWSTVASVFEVADKAKRRALWRECLRYGWSRRRLEAAKRQAVGSLAKVKGGGRRPQIDEETDPAVAADKLKDSMRSLRVLIDAATQVLPTNINRRLLRLRSNIAKVEDDL